MNRAQPTVGLLQFIRCVSLRRPLNLAAAAAFLHGQGGLSMADALDPVIQERPADHTFTWRMHVETLLIHGAPNRLEPTDCAATS